MVRKVKLAESGEDAVNKEIEGQVINQLDRSEKLDEIDTVVFGLETDDGKIVKVYVNADQADDFQKALADKLGEVDDIQECLNELSKEFDIVDVEWPGDSKDDEEEDEEGEEGQPETDGSEVMNKKVYDNNREKSVKDKIVKPKMEGKKFTFKSQMQLDENHHKAAHGSVEERMTTPIQLLVYHAIIELGIPELALNKSPYKSTIVASIKARATELNKFPTLKQALKVFVRRVHGLEDEGELKESIDVAEYIAESMTEDFWACITKVIRYLAPDAGHADEILDCTKFKTLVSRSSQSIPKVVGSDLRLRIQKLSDSMDANDATATMPTAKVTESVAPNVATDLFNNLFTLIDPTPGKSISKTLLNSPEWKAYFASIKPKLSNKFGGVMSQKFIDFCKVVQQAADESKPAQPAQPATPAAESVAPAQKILKEATEWSFTMEDDTAIVATEGMKMSLDPENLEKAVKGISGKTVTVVHDAADPKNKYTISPRGIVVNVKKIGENVSYQMNSEQVKDFMKLVNGEEESEKKPDDKKGSEEE